MNKPTGRVSGKTPNATCDVDSLFWRWQTSHDTRARDALIERFMPLARSLARRYSSSSEPMEDLIQVACLGLVKAVDRFDPSRGVKFQSYAIPTILGELRRYFRGSGWALHVPRSAQERALAVRSAERALVYETGRTPTAQRIAEYLELDLEQVLDALLALQAYETSSLDAPYGDEERSTYSESVGREDGGYALAEERIVLREAVSDIDERQRQVLVMSFFEELPQTEIGTRFGVSQMQISRVLSKTVDQLRHASEAAEPAPATPGAGV